MNSLPILILLGPPGSGKGTQAKELSESLHYTHLSTGDLLRNESKKKTPLGKEIKAYIDNGELVPDKTIINILLQSLCKNSSSQGTILDGFPRTLAQAQLLDKKCGMKKIIVFHLDVDDETIIKRIIQRRVCVQCGHLYHLEFHPPKKVGHCDVCEGKLEQRVDDTEAIIKKRLSIYHKEILPILKFYDERNKLLHINGDAPSRKITDSIIYRLKFHTNFQV